MTFQKVSAAAELLFPNLPALPSKGLMPINAKHLEDLFCRFSS